MDKLSKLILKTYAARTTLTISQLSAVLRQNQDTLFEVVNLLRERGYIRVLSGYEGNRYSSKVSPIPDSVPLEITFQGKVALEEEQTLSKEKRNAWIRYWITTAIAVAAFIKSFFF